MVAAIAALGGCTSYRSVEWGEGTSWAEASSRAQSPAAIRPRDDSEVPQRSPRKAPPFTHVVSGGDSIGGIAARYGVPASRIIEANNLRDPYTLRVGQRVVVPGGRPKPAPHVVAAAPASAVPGAGPSETHAGAPSVAFWAWDWSGSDDAEPAAAPKATVSAAPRPEPAPRKRLTPSSAQVAEAEVAPAGGKETAGPSFGEQLSARVSAFFASLFATGDDPAAEVATAQVLPKRSAEKVRAAAGTTAPDLTGEGFLWPVEGTVLAGFGERPDGTRNDGINIAAREGTPVLAAENGIVAYAGGDIPGFGQLILLRHEKDYMTAYAHNSALLAEVGDEVRRGQAIARVGRTGRVDSAQLHFEIRRGEQPVDPMGLLEQEEPRIAARN